MSSRKAAGRVTNKLHAQLLASEMPFLLRDGTGYRREDVIGICADQPDRAHHNYQDNGEHYGIFSYVLAFFVAPEVQKHFVHLRCPPVTGWSKVPYCFVSCNLLCDFPRIISKCCQRFLEHHP